MTTNAIEVRGLKKAYRDLPVLRGVDFDVAGGSILALLGSNGAGKTTVVKILSTLLRADAGAASVNGFDVTIQAPDVRRSVSLTGQFAAVDEILTGRENLVLIARLRHLKNPGTIADDLLARFSLTDAGARRGRGTRGPGNDGAPHHAVPGRGRTPRRPDHDPPPGPHRRERHARRGEAATAARRGRVRGRSLRHVTRSVDTIITTTLMPIAFLLLFVYVFGGAIESGSGKYVNYLLPGILLITIASGISYTAFRLFLDMQSGIFERFQSMPIARSSVLWAHVLTSLVANVISVAVVVLVPLLIGFRPGAGPLAWLAVAGILTLFTLALTWLAVIPGLSAKSADGASSFSYPLIFLPFVSSAFVPTGTMPSPVRAFAEHQPATSVVNAVRDLFTEQPVDSDVWIAVAWCTGILVVAHFCAMLTYRRKIS